MSTTIQITEGIVSTVKTLVVNYHKERGIELTEPLLEARSEALLKAVEEGVQHIDLNKVKVASAGKDESVVAKSLRS